MATGAYSRNARCAGRSATVFTAPYQQACMPVVDGILRCWISTAAKLPPENNNCSMRSGWGGQQHRCRLEQHPSVCETKCLGSCTVTATAYV